MKFYLCEHCIHGLDALYDVSTEVKNSEEYLYSVEEDLSDVFKLASNKTGYIVKEINAYATLNLMQHYIK